MKSQLELYQELSSRILGHFDMVSHATIYPDRHSSDAEVTYTYIHEETHRKIISSTTFGSIQLILADIVKVASKTSSLEWAADAKDILTETIKQSWIAHEGYAVYREIHYGRLVEPSHE